MGFPTRDKITKALEKIAQSGSYSVVTDANDDAEKMKRSFCTILIQYKEVKKLSTKNLSFWAEGQETQISKILHYQISNMTLDELIGVLERISGTMMS